MNQIGSLDDFTAMPDDTATSNYKCQLPSEVQLYASTNLNEDPLTRNDAIMEMRQWLQSKSYLNAHIDIASILYFLRGCKFNHERAKHKAVNYYEMRANCPEWFSNRDPCLPHLQHLIKLGVFLPLRQHHPTNGTVVIIIRATVHNPRKVLQNDIFKVSKMVMEIVSRTDEMLSIYGVHAVIDLSNVTFAHALQLTPSIIKKLVHAWQDCYPLRTRSIDFINCPTHINVVLNIFRSFMSEKMRKRLHVHGKAPDILTGIIAPEILPEEYGGTAGKLSDLIDYWVTTTTSYRDFFLEDEIHKADLTHLSNKT